MPASRRWTAATTATPATGSATARVEDIKPKRAVAKKPQATTNPVVAVHDQIGNNSDSDLSDAPRERPAAEDSSGHGGKEKQAKKSSAATGSGQKKRMAQKETKVVTSEAPVAAEEVSTEKTARKKRGRKVGSTATKAEKKDGDDQEDKEDGGRSDSDSVSGTKKKQRTNPPVKKPRAHKPTLEEEMLSKPGPIDLHPVITRDFASEGKDYARGGDAKFTGRLGYACLNTILRARKPEPVFASRTCRLKSIEEQGIQMVHTLARRNVLDLIPMLRWNHQYGIGFMRLSSEMFPFASHKEHGYSVKAVAAEELEMVGKVAKELGVRLTMHPGQFTQLGSPKSAIIDAAVRELTMHTEILEGMGVGKDGVLIVHGGGTYMDRPATLERIKDTIQNRLAANVRARLVLENDEMAYSAEELLPVCEELDVPLVLDFHHDLLRPSSQTPAELIPRINAIWERRGIKPKYHLSFPRAGARTLRERRAHSDRISQLPRELPADADLMIEAKDKEQAVLELMRVYQLVPIEQIDRAVRPPAELKMQGMKGSGKRSVTIKKDYASGGPGAGNAAVDGGDDGTQEDEEAESASQTTTGSPRKNKETQSEMAVRLLKRARAIAKKRGVEYTGPGAEIELSDDDDDEKALQSRNKLGKFGTEEQAERERKEKMTSEEVHADMLVRAEEIRNHLRVTGQRLKYDGNGIEGAADDLVDDAVDEEVGSEETLPKSKKKRAKAQDAIETVQGVPPSGEPVAGESQGVAVVA